MPRYARYIANNVLKEAKERLHHIYDTHDDVVVAFSGGKDSLVCLHLTKMVAEERGIKKVNAVFRDEELIHQEVIDFVRSYMDEPWLDLRYWCIPLASQKYVLNKTYEYVQWDPNREWVRPKPEWGLTEKDLGIPEGTVLTQYTADELAVAPYKGKVCLITGVRASESLNRYRSSVNKLTDNYLCPTTSPRATMGRPIFDWAENDVFRFFYDHKIAYCPIYDKELWAGVRFRVSSAIHTETAKLFGKYREFDPDLYSNVVDVFPEMITQEKYYKELDFSSIIEKYSQSWDTMREWIDENITDEKQYWTMREIFDGVVVRAEKDPGAYPKEYVFKKILGGVKSAIQPIDSSQRMKNERSN